MAKQRVLLAAMPYLVPTSSPLALALLKSILQSAGLATDCFYGPLRYPDAELTEGPLGWRFLHLYGGLAFGACLADHRHGAADGIAAALAEDYLRTATLDGLLTADARPAAETVQSVVRSAIRLARECIDRCVQDVDATLSVTFYTQLPGSLAFAERMKARNPGLRVVLGGSGVLADQAEGVLRSFPVVDAVSFTEADDTIVSLVRALRGELPLSSVRGMVYRDDGGGVRKTPPPPLRVDLDTLPLPDHSDFFAQHAASHWQSVGATLFFETSRGCWWGQKHLCTFCGLTERELAFRSKSPEAVYGEIETLYGRYPRIEYFHPTDDILDTRYFDTLLPMLARMPRRPRRPLRMFFEVKANMRLPHLLLLRAAGAADLQPGIESFSDEVLDLMSKGCSALGQIYFIKCAAQAEVGLVYNLLLRNVGESAAAYREMTRLVPYLTHLIPPTSLTTTELERFSPYWLRAAEYGIENIRPKRYLREIYRGSEVDHGAICYRFDYDHPQWDDPDLAAAHREFIAATRRWIDAYRPWQRFYLDRGDHLVLLDRRDEPVRSDILAGPAARLYRFLHYHRAFRRILAELPDLEEGFVRTQLVAWQARGLVWSTADDRHIALLPQRYERPPALETVLDMRPKRATGGWTPTRSADDRAGPERLRSRAVRP